jgi:hypothetical protein
METFLDLTLFFGIGIITFSLVYFVPKIVVKKKIKSLKVGDNYVSKINSQKVYTIIITSISDTDVYYRFNNDTDHCIFNMPKENFVIAWRKIE